MLGAVAWEPHAELDLAEWVEHGRRLGGAGRSCGWWIGDWLRYGNERFGERYTRASNATGLDVQTLMNMVYVALHVEVSRRRETLSWSHHAELAAMPVEQQERWLALAEEHKWSVRDMRTEIRNARHASEGQGPEGFAGGSAGSAGSGGRDGRGGVDGRDGPGGSAGPGGPGSEIAGDSLSPAADGPGHASEAIVCPRCGFEIDAPA